VPIPNLSGRCAPWNAQRRFAHKKKAHVAAESCLALSPSATSQLSRYLARLESSVGGCVEQQILWGAKT
jgi:hypothetical protein